MAVRSLKGMLVQKHSSIEEQVFAERFKVLGARSNGTAPKRSTYLMEALLLFTCLMVVIALSMSIFAYSSDKGLQVSNENDAMVLASNIAERFSADPMSIDTEYENGDLLAKCEISLSIDNLGTMYGLKVEVFNNTDRAIDAVPIYELKNSKYVSHIEAADDASSSSDRRVS